MPLRSMDVSNSLNLIICISFYSLFLHSCCFLSLLAFNLACWPKRDQFERGNPWGSGIRWCALSSSLSLSAANLFVSTGMHTTGNESPKLIHCLWSDEKICLRKIPVLNDLRAGSSEQACRSYSNVSRLLRHIAKFVDTERKRKTCIAAFNVSTCLKASVYNARTTRSSWPVDDPLYCS